MAGHPALEYHGSFTTKGSPERSMWLVRYVVAGNTLVSVHTITFADPGNHVLRDHVVATQAPLTRSLRLG